MIIEATSDLHLQMPALQGGADVLVVAGDIGWNGWPQEIEPYFSWMGSKPHKYKIYVPGNHDGAVEKSPELFKKKFAEWGVTMLIDESIIIEGIHFYGYPHVVPFKNWAFMPPDREREQLVKKIPKCDVLISHGPPCGIMDEAIHEELFITPHQPELLQVRKERVNTGCGYLARHLAFNRPQVMIFGHIHHQHGFEEHSGVRYYNVAYSGTFKTVLIEIKDRPITIENF